jgi:AcrR family transcriptional regulator
VATQPAHDRLLAAVVEHVRQVGTSDLSLRQVAAAVGSSHRMLLYHFGSKEQLLVEVARAVEQEQQEHLAGLATDGLSAADAARAMWARFTDPAMAPNERLFFELYGQALMGRPGTTALLEGDIEAWVDGVAEQAVALGLPVETARADARLGVAVVRGLLMDLLATGDREAVDEAFGRWVVLQEQALAHRR